MNGKWMLPGVLCLALAAGCGRSGGHIRLVLQDGADSLTVRAADIFARTVENKAGRPLVSAFEGGLTLSLREDADIPAEGFRVEKMGRNNLVVSASEGHGFLYGLGHVLHRGCLSDTGFIPGDCEGLSVPDKPVRGIYFATHFNNFYHQAPLDEVRQYVEELALWGYNGLQVWFDMHHYTGIDDPAAVAMLDRLSEILRACEAAGMRSGLTMLANEGYATTPEELRAKRIGWTAHYGTEICPSRPGGMDLILRNRREFLDAFASRGVHVTNVWIWPYDQGGCSCESCRPWGANGYLKLSKPLSSLLREELPGVDVVLSTWLFDFEEQDKGEWRGLAAAFDQETPWVDKIMADSHTDFPSFLGTHPVPGGLPLENFPEISMWRSVPWGGYGANPLPERFQALYLQAKDKVVGGYPYSEGKFEDINKVIYSRLYWHAETDAQAALKDYVRYEFGAEHVDSVCTAVNILEKNHGLTARSRIMKPGAERRISVPESDFGAERAFRILDGIDRKLPERVRASWRWRILYLRAFLDWQFRLSGGWITPETDAAFRELIAISHVENGQFVVRPPYVEQTE